MLHHRSTAIQYQQMYVHVLTVQTGNDTNQPSVHLLPTFLTHNDAIAGFISQNLGLPPYACKMDS